MEDRRKKTNPISDMLFPSDIKCIICSKELNHDLEFCVCSACKLKINDEICLRCGRRVENLSDYCETCKNFPQVFDKARSTYVFDDLIRILVHKFKYGNEIYLSDYIAQMMYRTYQNEKFEADIITFVPLHYKREKRRGYNQAKLIADKLGEKIDIPVFGLLKKIKHTKNMAKLSAKQRQALIKDSFLLETDKELKGKKILLIDDVFTTGSTANECARMLKAAKPKSVYVLTLASLPTIPKPNKSQKKLKSSMNLKKFKPK